MAKRTRTGRTKQRRVNLPGFSAEASLGLTRSRWRATVAGSALKGGAGLIPQLGLGSASGGNVGEYVRCRANGGGDLVCRFFAGLPPFTIGRFLF